LTIELNHKPLKNIPMLELLFNVLLQLAIVTGGASSEAKTNAKTKADQAATQAKVAAPTTPTTNIGAGGWDDND